MTQTLLLVGGGVLGAALIYLFIFNNNEEHPTRFSILLFFYGNPALLSDLEPSPLIPPLKGTLTPLLPPPYLSSLPPLADFVPSTSSHTLRICGAPSPSAIRRSTIYSSTLHRCTEQHSCTAYRQSQAHTTHTAAVGTGVRRIEGAPSVRLSVFAIARLPLSLRDSETLVAFLP